MNVWKSVSESVDRESYTTVDDNQFTNEEYEYIGSLYLNAINNCALEEAFEDYYDDIITEGANREMASKLKEAKKLYKQYLKESKKNINSGNYDEANKCIQQARNKVKEIQKEVSSIDVNFFGDIKGWILSLLISMVENIVPNILVRVSAKQNADKIIDAVCNDFDDLFNQFESGKKTTFGSTFRKLSKTSISNLGAIGKIGKGLQGARKLIHLITNIYGIGKTISEKGSFTQAINTFRSKILAQFALLDGTLALFQKDIERLKKKNS